jgi:integrase/recombinase XerD
MFTVAEPTALPLGYTRTSASTLIEQAYLDFRLSRQAMLVSDKTLRFYHFTLGRFIQWQVARGKAKPLELSVNDIRSYLSSVAERGASDSYVWGHARSIKAFVRFLHSEAYIQSPLLFPMPTVATKRLPCPSAEEIKRVLDSCLRQRDKAIILVFSDTGVRASELLALNWGDIDIGSGLVRVARGKGGKARSVVVGISTRRAVLKYRRSIESVDEVAPFVVTKSGRRMTQPGLRSLLVRLGGRAHVKLTPHALRRAFATLSLRAGMNPLHLQGLLGHSTLEMTRRYVQMLDDDLVLAHEEHGPVDTFLR